MYFFFSSEIKTQFYGENFQDEFVKKQDHFSLNKALSAFLFQKSN